MRPKTTIVLSLALSFCAGLAVAGEPKTVVSAAAGAEKFKTFGKILVASDMIKTLEGDGPWTVFAPTDAAFAKVPKADLAALMKDRDKLKSFVMHHVHGGKKSLKDLTGSKVLVKTMRGLELRFDNDDGVRVNEVKVSKPDVSAVNGYVHGIDGVLKPIEHVDAPAAPQQPGEAKEPKEPKDADDAKEGKAVDSLYALSTTTLEGKTAALADYKGKVTLVVNVASECGYTPQYAGLEKLHSELSAKGFSVLGFPSNDFGGQEPGDPAQIRKFCDSKYKVTFPLFSKVATKGKDQSPVYAFLGKGRETPNWNFCKYLVGKDGRVINYYKSGTKPDDAELRKAIEEALK